VVSETHTAEIECPSCDGDGCKECAGGYFEIKECPSKYIGQELIADIGVVTASEHHLPCVGGILDQSAWWFELRQHLRSEESKIQDEQSKRNQS
jgi:hypothetical protein